MFIANWALREQDKATCMILPLFFCIHAATSGNTNCIVADILSFSSGADRIPPLGFGKRPSLEFFPVQDRFGVQKFATASTCDIVLRLPTSHGDNYESFKEAMIMSLKDNDGFGGV